VQLGWPREAGVLGGYVLGWGGPTEIWHCRAHAGAASQLRTGGLNERLAGLAVLLHYALRACVFFSLK